MCQTRRTFVTLGTARVFSHQTCLVIVRRNGPIALPINLHAQFLALMLQVVWVFPACMNALTESSTAAIQCRRFEYRSQCRQTHFGRAIFAGAGSLARIHETIKMLPPQQQALLAAIAKLLAQGGGQPDRPQDDVSSTPASTASRPRKSARGIPSATPTPHSKVEPVSTIHGSASCWKPFMRLTELSAR